MAVDEKDAESVWQQMQAEHPEFTRRHTVSDNHHVLREIILGGSPTWAGVWQRFQPGPGKRVMDIGANVGAFATFCALQGADVVAYEPFFDVCAMVAQMAVETGLSEKLRIKNAAVWRHTGEIPYLGHRSELDGCRAFNGSVPSQGIHWNEDDFQRARRTKCVSLEDAIRHLEWDCVKMDIEGAEFDVLLGAPGETLSRIRFMFVEFHPWATRDMYEKTIAKLKAAFQFEGAYMGKDHRWESAYCTRR